MSDLFVPINRVPVELVGNADRRRNSKSTEKVNKNADDNSKAVKRRKTGDSLFVPERDEDNVTEPGPEQQEGRA